MKFDEQKVDKIEIVDQKDDYSSSNYNKYQCNYAFVVKRIDKFTSQLRELIKNVKHANVISIGCGEGFDLRNLVEKSNIDFKFCCGVDIKFKALKIAQKILRKMDFHGINGDAYNIPIKLNRFDLVLCLEVLEHLSHPDKVLEEISEGFSGHCIFSVPNEPLYRLTRLLFKQNVLQLGNHPEHVNHWSKYTFSRLIEKYFTIDKFLTPFPWTIVLCHKPG